MKLQKMATLLSNWRGNHTLFEIKLSNRTPGPSEYTLIYFRFHLSINQQTVTLHTCGDGGLGLYYTCLFLDPAFLEWQSTEERAFSCLKHWSNALHIRANSKATIISEFLLGQDNIVSLKVIITNDKCYIMLFCH